MSQMHHDLLNDAAAYVDQWVSYQQERRDVPGVVVAMQHDDRRLLERGYGYADLERHIAMTPRHIFRIASHSKTFTATAIMQLVEQGLVRLDDPVANYIPWLQALDALARVTVRQALNHTTGIVRDGLDADYWQLVRPFPDAGDLRRLVEQGGAVLPANELFKYSNMAYSLLGMAIESASGMPYHEFVKQRIIRPLGLADTGPETDEHAQPRLATGYTVRRLGVPRRPLPDVATHAMAAATGFYSTAADLCRYAAGHFFGNDVLLSDAAKREMQQPYWVVEHADEHYGLGFDSLLIGERHLIGHGGSFPGFATRTLIDTRDRLAIVVLTNETGGPALDFARTITKIVDFSLRLPRTPSALPAGAHARFTGRFANLWGVTDVVAFGDCLVALIPDEADPVKSPTMLAIEDDDTLRIVATNGYGSPGESIRYLRDAAGRVAKIVLGGMSAYPVDVFRTRESAI